MFTQLLFILQPVLFILNDVLMCLLSYCSHMSDVII